METKEDQRKGILSLRREQDEDLRIKHARKIGKRLLSLLPKHTKTVFLYASFNHETDTWELMEELWRMKIGVALPRVEKDGLRFYEIKGKNELIKSKMGIFEPDPKLCAKADHKDSVLLVPVVGFDEDCNRMGYGGGYYDRYLLANRKKHRLVIGLAFELQRYEGMICDENDEPLDFILTEKRTIKK